MARYLVTFLPGNPIPTRIKYVDDAAVPPDSGDDAATLGVTVGSLWLDTVADKVYFAKSVGTGTAEWLDLSGGTGADDTQSLHIDLTVTGAHTIDRADGATHDLTLIGNATFTLAGAAIGEATDLRIILRQSGSAPDTVVWPGTIEWAGGAAPTLQTTAGAVDTIGLLSVDDGATWFGYVVDTSDPVLDLEDLSDVDLTTPAEGDTLRYRSGEWVNEPADSSEGAVGALLISDDHSTPIIFADLLLTEEEDDFLYADVGG